MYLEKMTWPEAKEAFDAGTVVVFPTGSIEQHGPHLPLGTDYLVAKQIGELLAEDNADCIVAPTLSVGFADYHTDFPGTVSVEKQETLRAYIKEAVNNYVQYGVKHILFVNAHGGNMGALKSVCYELRKENIVAGTLLWWDIVAQKVPEKSPAGHGDWVETSMMLAIDEGLVSMEKASKPSSKSLTNPNIEFLRPDTFVFDQVPVHVHMRTKDFTDSGDMPEPGLTAKGDVTIPPTAATKEIGEELFAVVVSFIRDFVKEFKKIKL